MGRINIRDANNTVIEVDFIRYFKHKDTSYFIYTQNEYDEKEFVKLYIVKVMKQFGEFITKTIKDEDEWKTMQLIVKKFITEIKNENIQSFFDLDRADIINVKIKQARFFKLDKKLMKLLQKNDGVTYNENNDSKIDFGELPEINEIAPVDVTQNMNDDYQQMYFELKKDNDELNEIMADMLLELSEYRTKYGDIQEGN